MGENIITWNVTNWITIVLMAFLGFVILAAVGSVFHKSNGGMKSGTMYDRTSATATGS